jgi:acetoin:2,6-dichlorophenolindophenol oxidoreductase subunit beta
MPKVKNISVVNAINEAIDVSMQKDKDLICYGLGTTDPKGIFNTTLNLEKKYGKNRVFDTPASENALTGVAIGAALNGTRVLLSSQRADFFLLAMDQLVNGAAKWRYMFGGQHKVPITIRLIVGRGWGQGPTHSQNFHSWFSNVPGLKVVMPTSPKDHKGLLISSIFDDNPVIFIEQRWIHNTVGPVSENFFKTPIGKADIVKEGSDITIVAMSYLTNEAIRASKYLKEIGINAEILDLRSLKPIDYNTILKSVKKTRRIIVLDPSHKTCSYGSEIISTVSQKLFNKLKAPPSLMTFPDFPMPTSQAFNDSYYFGYKKIYIKIAKNIFNKKPSKIIQKDINKFNDVPDKNFLGPF